MSLRAATSRTSWHPLERISVTDNFDSIENWDRTARTQYEYKLTGKPHPYGNEEEPNKFRDFHVFTKLRVLYRLCQWTLWNPDNMKKHFPEAKETDQFLDWVRRKAALVRDCGMLTSHSKHTHVAGIGKTVFTTSYQAIDSTDVRIRQYPNLPPKRS